MHVRGDGIKWLVAGMIYGDACRCAAIKKKKSNKKVTNKTDIRSNIVAGGLGNSKTVIGIGDYKSATGTVSVGDEETFNVVLNPNRKYGVGKFSLAIRLTNCSVVSVDKLSWSPFAIESYNVDANNILRVYGKYDGILTDELTDTGDGTGKNSNVFCCVNLCSITIRFTANLGGVAEHKLIQSLNDDGNTNWSYMARKVDNPTDINFCTAQWYNKDTGLYEFIGDLFYGGGSHMYAGGLSPVIVDENDYVKKVDTGIVTNISTGSTTKVSYSGKATVNVSGYSGIYVAKLKKPDNSTCELNNGWYEESGYICKVVQNTGSDNIILDGITIMYNTPGNYANSVDFTIVPDDINVEPIVSIPNSGIVLTTTVETNVGDETVVEAPELELCNEIIGVYSSVLFKMYQSGEDISIKELVKETLNIVDNIEYKMYEQGSGTNIKKNAIDTASIIENILYKLTNTSRLKEEAVDIVNIADKVLYKLYKQTIPFVDEDNKAEVADSASVIDSVGYKFRQCSRNKNSMIEQQTISETVGYKLYTNQPVRVAMSLSNSIKSMKSNAKSIVIDSYNSDGKLSVENEVGDLGRNEDTVESDVLYLCGDEVGIESESRELLRSLVANVGDIVTDLRPYYINLFIFGMTLTLGHDCPMCGELKVKQGCRAYRIDASSNVVDESVVIKGCGTYKEQTVVTLTCEYNRDEYNIVGWYEDGELLSTQYYCAMVVSHNSDIELILSSVE